MIEVHSLRIDFQIGIFHDVVAVHVDPRRVTIANKEGRAFLLPIKPVFNPLQAEFEDIEVEGMFGTLDECREAMAVPGVQLTEIVRVAVVPDVQDHPVRDFHCRMLRIETSMGITLQWQLFCEGKMKDESTD